MFLKRKERKEKEKSYKGTWQALSYIVYSSSYHIIKFALFQLGITPDCCRKTKYS